MRIPFLTLPLGMAVTLATTSALALDGTINFSGKITSATCPIEIVNPESGAVSNLVPMGEVDAGEFTTSGSEAGGRGFQMRISPDSTCIINPNQNATVTFTSVQGGAGDYYGIKPTPDAAKGIAVAIKDNTGAFVPSGTASTVYPISENDPTLMYFVASYISTAATVSAGPADADVNFRVDIN